MTIRLYPKTFIQGIVTQTGLSASAILQIIEQQRADIVAVEGWVEANAGADGTTVAETLANAWLPGDPPANAADVIAIAAAARVVVAIGEEDGS